MISNKLTARPFLKWAGGKTKNLPEIRKLYPYGFSRYAEPFLGGGAVFFDIASRRALSQIYLSDINSELIETYMCVRDHISDLAVHLNYLERRYLSAPEEDRKQIYGSCRSRYNLCKSDWSHRPAELAALFIFLNKTCYNGLYRVNQAGAFNVPVGSYKNPKIFDLENLALASQALQGAEIVCADFEQAREFIDNDTFVYFDPPYRPLSYTSNFTSYTENGFNDQEQIRLARFVDELSAKGAYVLVSNSAPADGFFEGLYSKHKIKKISTPRSINSRGTARGKISELLILGYAGKEIYPCPT